MKTLCALVVIGTMSFLCGCGGAKPGEGADDSLARVKKAGVIKWGADPSGGAPFVFTDPSNPDRIIGFEIDIMEKVAGHLGVKHEIVKGQWDTLPANLLALRSDMVMNGIEINDERRKVVAFSEPYYVYEQQLTVRTEDKDKYTNLDSLKGRKVGTLSGAEANNVLKAAGFAEDLLVPHDDSYTPYRNLELGRVDAVLQEDVIAAHYAAPDKMPKVFNQPKTFAAGKYAVAVRLADKSLLAEINRILDEMKKNGELAAIYRKWNIWSDREKEIGILEKK